MSPQTPKYPADPEQLLTYLQAARSKRKLFSFIAGLGLVVACIALALVVVIVINQHNALVDGCQRAHARDREIARLQLHAGAVEDRRAALARAGTDCGQLFKLLPF